MLSRSTRLIGCALLALAAAGFFWFGASGADEAPVVRTHSAPQFSRLAQGDWLQQSAWLDPGSYSGIYVYAHSPAWFHQRIQVELTDEAGRVLGRSWGAVASYDNDGLLRLEFPMATFMVAERIGGMISITNVDGPLLLLAATPVRAGDSSSGTLFRNGEDRHRLLAWSLRRPVPVSEPVKQGALAAMVFFLGASLVETYVPPRWRWWAYGGLLAAVVALALPGFWFSRRFLGIADWDYYFSLHTYYRNIILKYHQFPFWNPYTCGGTAGLGDPESPLFTLTFLLELIFGIPRGARLAIFTAGALGAAGMLLLAKRLKLSPLAGAAAALIATFSSVSLLEIVEGHVNVLAAKWIPWIFYAWYAAYQAGSKKPAGAPGRNWVNGWTILCGFFLAMTFYAGGVYLLMYTGLAFLLLWVLARRHTDAMRVTVVAGLVALCLASFKLVPVLEWLDQFPDQAYASSTVTLPGMVDILLGRHLHGSYVLFGQESGWHEYGAYVGAGALALALVGAVVYRRWRIVQALVVATVAALLLSSTGPALRPLFDVLWFFPRSNISRFVLFAIIPLALLAGFGVEYFERKRLRSLWPLLMVGIVALELLTLASSLSYQAFILPRVYPRIPRATSPLEFTAKRFDEEGQGSRHTRAYAAARAGYGTFTYCSVLGPSISGVRTIEDEEDHDPVWIEDKQGEVKLLEWTPNRVRVGVHAPVPTKVGLNTNYAKGWWVVDEGSLRQPAQEVGNRVGLVVEPGEHTLTFEYKTPGLRIGTTITLAMVMGLVVWGWSRRKA